MLDYYTIKVILLFISIQSILSMEYHCNRSKVSCGCGISSVRHPFRIVNGISVQPQTWPMIVSLKYTIGDQIMHRCAGTILNRWFILTAAHCVDLYGIDDLKTNRLIISTGNYNRSSSDSIIHQVDRIILHHDWKIGSSDFRYDIALLHLSKPLNFIGHSSIMRTCWPPLMMNFDEIMAYPSNGTELMIIGWGRLGTHESDTDHLQQALVYAIHHHERICQDSIYDPTIQFCAGRYEGGTGTCYGDSGGPILRWISDRWEQVGIVSYSKANCAITGFPNIYTRLTYFIPWIRSYLDSVDETTTTMSLTNTYRCRQPPPPSCGCGQRDVTILSSTSSAIRDASDGAWPMIVSVLLNTNGQQLCTGSIISQSFVVTAAYCGNFYSLFDSGGIIITAGVTNRSDPTRLIRNVDRIHVHPLYNASARDYRHDIALLHLAHPLPIDDNQRMTRSCLHHFNSSILSREHPKSGTQLAIIGWGTIRFNLVVIPEILQQAEISTIGTSNDEMQQFIGPLEASTVFHPGAGIFRWAGSYWEQVGILPYQTRLNQDSSTGVYHRLSLSYGWIKSIVEKDNEQIETSPAKQPDPTMYPCQFTSKSCGCSMNNVVVVSNEHAEVSAYTWSMIVSVQINKFNHTCAGTILSDSFILTAAHCAFKLIEQKDASIIAGIHALSDQRIGIHRRIDRIFLNPQWLHTRPHLHDIAILHLHQPLSVNAESWQWAKTCVSDDENLLVYNNFTKNSVIMMIDWDLSLKDEHRNIVLQQRFVQLISNEDPACSSVINNSHYQFCARTLISQETMARTNHCDSISDSTASIFIYRNSHWEQIGIVSDSHSCDQNGDVRVYTRLTFYTGWIISVTNESAKPFSRSSMNNHNKLFWLVYALILLHFEIDV